MAKKLTPEQIIEAFENYDTKEQLRVKSQIDNILSEKKKKAKAEVQQLESVDEIK